MKKDPVEVGGKAPVGLTLAGYGKPSNLKFRA